MLISHEKILEMNIWELKKEWIREFVTKSMIEYALSSASLEQDPNFGFLLVRSKHGFKKEEKNKY